MERKTKADNKIIFNQKLAGYLMVQGFILKKMERNEKCPDKNVFIFRQSENLEKTIKEYLSK
jgi:hypothetical protein